MVAMYAVAITRRPGAVQQDEVVELAAMATMDPYSMRLLLAGALPVVLPYVHEAEVAQLWLAVLRGRGLGAIACDLERVPAGEDIRVARSFAFGPTGMVFGCADGAEARLEFADVVALVHVMLASESETATAKQEKMLSVGRTLATGGLARNKTVTKHSREQSHEAEPALYVVPSSVREPILLRQNQLRYQGLGAPLPPTKLTCFQALLARLRQLAPEALYDDRLLRQKRKPGQLEHSHSQSVAGGAKQKSTTMTQTNTGATELAVFLLTVAHLRHQL